MARNFFWRVYVARDVSLSWCTLIGILNSFWNILTFTSGRTFFDEFMLRVWSSGISLNSRLWGTASNRNGFLMFCIVLWTLQLLVTLGPLVQFRWGFQQKAPPNEHFNQDRKRSPVLDAEEYWFYKKSIGYQVAFCQKYLRTFQTSYCDIT